MNLALVALCLALQFGVGGTASAQRAAVSPQVTLQLKEVPLREAVKLLFQDSGQSYSIHPDVTDVPISLVLRDVPLESALRLLLRQAAVAQPGLSFSKDGSAYVIRREKPIISVTPGPNKKVTVNLKDVPLRQAIDALFAGTGFQYSVNPDVQNVLVNLNIRDVDVQAAIRLLLRQASTVQPGLTFTKDGEIFIIRVRPEPRTVQPGGEEPPTMLPEPEPVTEKISIQFRNAAELVSQLEQWPLPREVISLQPVKLDNSLLIRATPEAIEAVKKLVRLIDIPARTLAIRIGVTGPGVGARPLQLASMARTINGRDVLIDEQTTSGTQMARLKVLVKPLVQGDGDVLTESDWDISVPVAGGPKGPIRLVKRLTTTARLRPGRGITVGEVDLAPFGGNGTVRLWLRADVLESSLRIPTTTAAGEPIDGVEVFAGRPYVNVPPLVAALGGQLRRASDRHYELRQGSPDNADLPEGEAPGLPGPFRLTHRGQLISDRLMFGYGGIGELRLDPSGTSWIPLEDLARALGGKLTYDSAADSYEITGGRRLSSLRFPAAAGATGKR